MTLTVNNVVQFCYNVAGDTAAYLREAAPSALTTVQDPHVWVALAAVAFAVLLCGRGAKKLRTCNRQQTRKRTCNRQQTRKRKRVCEPECEPDAASAEPDAMPVNAIMHVLSCRITEVVGHIDTVRNCIDVNTSTMLELSARVVDLDKKLEAISKEGPLGAFYHLPGSKRLHYNKNCRSLLRSGAKPAVFGINKLASDVLFRTGAMCANCAEATTTEVAASAAERKALSDAFGKMPVSVRGAK